MNIDLKWINESGESAAFLFCVKGMSYVEVVITDIGIDQTEVYRCGILDHVDLTTVKISFYIKGCKSGILSGEHEMPFERYRKMTHDDLTDLIKEVFTVA